MVSKTPGPFLILVALLLFFFSGICVRHLGLVRAASLHSRVRTCLLSEGLARVIKLAIRAELRKTLANAQVASSHKFRQCLCDTLNRIFVAKGYDTDVDRLWCSTGSGTGNGDANGSSRNTTTTTKSTQQHNTNTFSAPLHSFKALLCQKFGDAVLSDTEKQPEYDLRTNVSLASLLLRVKDMVHIEFHDLFARDVNSEAKEDEEQTTNEHDDNKNDNQQYKTRSMFCADIPIDLLDIVDDHPSVRSLKSFHPKYKLYLF